ncbi:MAG: hypothetical protein ACI376_08610 [Candidatus Bruticola sp.]
MGDFMKHIKNWCLSALRLLLISAVVVSLGTLSACYNVPSGSSLSAKEIAWAFAEAALVKNDRNSAGSLLSEEAKISANSLLDIVGGTVESTQFIEIDEKEHGAGSQIKIKAETSKSHYIKEVVLVLLIEDGRTGKTIRSLYGSLLTKNKEVISL